MSIQFKRSSTAGLAPAVSDVKQGEIVINLPDKKIYTLDNNNTVVNIGFSKSEADTVFVPKSGTTMTGVLKSYSTACLYPSEFTPKQYVDSLVSTTASTTASTIAAWKTWLPVAGGTMTGRIILNGLSPMYDNEAVSRLYVSSNYYSKSGGVLNGSIELYATTPYIDFHNANSSADYTSRIIASDSATLQLVSTNIILSGAVTINGNNTVSGNITTSNTVQGGYVLSTGVVHANSNVTAGGNITTSNTVQGGYVLSTGDIHANSDVTAAGTVQGSYVHSTGDAVVDGKMRAAFFRANSGAPSGDGSRVGYSFENNGDSGIFYEGQSSSYAGGSLVFRNDSANIFHCSNSTLYLNTNTYYKGTLLDNIINSSNSVAVLSGSVSNGGTIPLPSGYTEAQCKWTVSLKDSNVNNNTWDVDEDVTKMHYKTYCYTSGRSVTAYMRIWNDDNKVWSEYAATANYIIIGVK